MRHIYGDDFFNAEVDFAASRLELARSSASFKSAPEMVASLDGIIAAIEAAHAESYALLIDFRAASQIEDSEYQRAFFHFERFLFSRFRSVAVVHTTQESIDSAQNSSRGKIHYFLTLAGARRALSSLQSTAPQMKH